MLDNSQSNCLKTSLSTSLPLCLLKTGKNQAACTQKALLNKPIDIISWVFMHVPEYTASCFNGHFFRTGVIFQWEIGRCYGLTLLFLSSTENNVIIIAIIYIVSSTSGTICPVVNECCMLDRKQYKLQNNKLSHTVCLEICVSRRK